MEYFLIILSTVLFGGQFIALNAYQDKEGKSIQSIFFFCALFSLVAVILFASISLFIIGFNIYTLLLSLIAAIIQITLQIVGIKALSLGRVEVYTLFNVTGGMSVAYIFGITYFNEPIKVTHIVGLALLLICLLVPVIFDKKEKKKSNWMFYLFCILVFLANGFFGAVNKIHINSNEGLGITQYMFYVYSWICLLSSLGFVITYLIKKKEEKFKFNKLGILFALIYGLVNSVGMSLQYAFADKVPASILFPLSNGGCIVFALIFSCLFYRKKPALKDIIQFVIAIGGMVLFFF